MPHTFCEGVQPNKLYQLIKDKYPLINVVTVQRRHFNDSAGRQNIQTLCAPQYNGVYVQVLQKYVKFKYFMYLTYVYIAWVI